MSSSIKKRPTDSVASCLQGNNDGPRDFDHSSAKSRKSEVDTNRVFGLTTAEANVLNSKDTKPHLNSFEFMAPKDVTPNDLEVDDYSKQRTKDEIKELLGSIGLRYKFAKFESIWQKSITYEVGYNENPFRKTATLSSVMRAIKELHFNN